jgi:hypothetical protein
MSDEQEIIAEVMQSARTLRRIAVAFNAYTGRGGAARAGLEAVRDARRHSQAADTSLRGLDGPGIVRAFAGEQRAARAGGQTTGVTADADQLRALRDFTDAGRPGAHQATQPATDQQTGPATRGQNATARRTSPQRGGPTVQR